MGSYGQYCPIAKAAEILAERWTPLIIREFLVGSHHFNELERGLPGISRSLLSRRLHKLQRAGVIERRPAAEGRGTAYYLTPAGRELRDVIFPLGEWGARWAFADPRPKELDPALLLWWMHRRISRDLLPPRRTNVQFDFRGTRVRTFWLVLEPAGVSVCLQDPGFDVDLLVAADIAAFYRVWLGRLSFGEAVREGLIELDGPRALVRAFPRWLQWSHFHDAVRATRRRPASKGYASPALILYRATHR